MSLHEFLTIFLMTVVGLICIPYIYLLWMELWDHVKERFR